MTEIRKAGETNALSDIDVPQGEFRSQVAALTDAVRQLGGNPEIAPGSAAVNSPLNSPYILYVNSYTGSDKFVTGEYASADDGTFEQKMRRIANQRLECGYTEARPFKTINRAAIEAGIITSKDYLNLPGNLCGDLVTIVVMSGVHDVVNGFGAASTSAWADGYEPDDAELQKFNAADGGVILPRGCSVVSMDLRKTNLRPTYVPAFDQENANYSNRSSIFRVTGTGYYYGFTFLDKPDYNQSHHLLDTFSFAGRLRTDAFYAKIRSSFGSFLGTSDALARTRNSEVRIVGPQPNPGLQSETTDTVESASPYIYNCSIRSVFGLCGIFANGADVEGFKSMVVAQYTAISMQKDMRCWQRYNSGTWSTINQADYNTYINESPDNVRMDPRYRSIHIRCVNRAIIQEVSVFAIGQGVHHAVSSGGEITITNSNSNFGGVCALAEGFVDDSFATDRNWNVSEIRVSADISELFGNVSRISLGTVDAATGNNATTIRLEDALTGSENLKPDVLANDGYSLDNYGGTNLLWIENPAGDDYYAPLANNAWETGQPDRIDITQAMQTPGGSTPTAGDPTLPSLAGLNVYVRRLRDTRTLEQRSNTLLCSNTAADSRNMIRDYGIQTDDTDSAIDREIRPNEPVVVATVGVTSEGVGGGVFRRNRIELRRAAASANWDDRGQWNSAYHATNLYYRVGDVVRYQNKHFKCVKENNDSVFDVSKWDECFVHMPEDYAGEDYFKNSKALIVFDKDQDTTGGNQYLGYNPQNCFSNDDQVSAQHRTTTDYLGLYSFLRSLGFGAGEAHQILLPQPSASRDINPSAAYNGIGNPNGAANSWDNWALELRRPSNMRLFGHAFEWAGQLNYTKALPQYQRDLSASNKFTYFFTNSLGGRVYVSGFNEEGFGVSAAGLTDLQTGETLDPGSIGGDRDPNAVTVFGDVRINGSLEADTIISNQESLVRWLHDPQFPPNRLLNGGSTADPQGTKGKGFAWLASVQHITGLDNQLQYESIDRDNEDSRGASSAKKGPHFVNPYYLDLWRVQNRLVSARTEPLYIWVNPRGVVPADFGDIDFRNQNGNGFESANAGVTNIADVLNYPPDDPRHAVQSLQLAKEFADISVSPLSPVVIFCGPGLYIHDQGEVTFEHPTTIRAYDYSRAADLNDTGYGGEIPFLNGDRNNGTGSTVDGVAGHSALQGNALRTFIDNSSNHPVFLTKINVDFSRGNRPHIKTRPLTLRFKKESLVAGVVWYGIQETLRHAQGTQNADDNRIPNSYHDFSRVTNLDNAAFEAIRQLGPDEMLGEYLERWGTANGTTNFIFHKSKPVIRSEESVKVYNVAIGAISLPLSVGEEATDASVFQSVNGGAFQVGGLYLMGNAIWTTSNTAEWRGSSTAVFQGFAQSLFGVAREYKDAPLRFALGGQQKNNAGGTSFDWNLPCNNIHLFNNNYEYMDEDYCADSNSSFGQGDANDVPMLHGPGFRFIFGSQTKNRYRLNGQLHFHNAFNNNDLRRQGVAGFFGLHKFGTGISHTGTVPMDQAAYRTRTNVDTRRVGAHALDAGSEVFYDNSWVLFQRNGRARPGQPRPTYLSGAAAEDIAIEQDQWDTTNNVEGYLQSPEFKAIGIPITTPNDTVNVKCFTSAPRIDFKTGTKVNARAYL